MLLYRKRKGESNVQVKDLNPKRKGGSDVQVNLS